MLNGDGFYRKTKTELEDWKRMLRRKLGRGYGEVNKERREDGPYFQDLTPTTPRNWKGGPKNSSGWKPLRL